MNGRLNLPARRQLWPPVLLMDEKPSRSPSVKSLSLGLPHMTSAKYSGFGLLSLLPLSPNQKSADIVFQSVSFTPHLGGYPSLCKSRRDMKRLLSFPLSFRSNVCNAANVVVRRVSPPFERKKERERERPKWDRHRRRQRQIFRKFRSLRPRRRRTPRRIGGEFPLHVCAFGQSDIWLNGRYVNCSTKQIDASKAVRCKPSVGLHRCTLKVDTTKTCLIALILPSVSF